MSDAVVAGSGGQPNAAQIKKELSEAIIYHTAESPGSTCCTALYTDVDVIKACFNIIFIWLNFCSLLIIF